ncbi:hypothetical protein [Kutzneria sp. 744]|uniref:hypothetical protein n=1 Tax=Kutzneria sp. (strain 744) TaxID=345341 RepID=UPI0003EEDA85|nr:hypothetical protein [Kutzneria sp. 744]EWM19722.1 hypothetical protein KUTG_10026 [Kutzneria sp. 744]
MTHAQRRKVRAATDRARQRWGQIATAVARGERWWHFTHEQDLSDAERDDIQAALKDLLRNQWSNEVDHNGRELEAAYHAGFILSCAWLIFSGTEAYELHEVFNRHRIALHPDWWITDGWGEWHSKYGVRCDGCNTSTYADAESIDADPADVAWPRTCCGCRSELPQRHDTSVCGADTSWWAECSCGWSADSPAKAARYAKALATRHRNIESQKTARATQSAA